MSNFHVVAANLIEEEGNYLLVEEGKEAVKHQWNFPSGGVDPDEGLENAAKREALEETGLNVEIKGLIGVFVDESDMSDDTVLVFVFHSIPKDMPPLIPDSDEILDVDFFSKEDFSDIDIRIPFLDEAVKRYEDGEIKPVKTIRDVR